jgi:hypothetical protein
MVETATRQDTQHLLDALDAQLLTSIDQDIVNWLEKQSVVEETIASKHNETYWNVSICCLPRAIVAMI